MKKYWIQILVLILLILLFSGLDVSEYIISIREVGLNIWITLIFLQMITFSLILIQWQRIGAALGKTVSYRDMIFVNMRGIFYDTVTPGLKVGGEVAKGASLVNKMDFTTAQASALVVIQKSISIFALVLLSIFSFMFLNSEGNMPQYSVGISYVVLIAILMLIIIILFLPERLYSYLLKMKSEGKIKNKVKDFLEKYIEAFDQMKKNKQEISLQLMISFIIWTLFPAKLYYIVNALGIELSFGRIFAVTIISYIASMVPLLPGGLGSFEGTMTGLLLMWGIGSELGLIITTLFRFTTFWLQFFVSAIYLAGKKVNHRLKGA